MNNDDLSVPETLLPAVTPKRPWSAPTLEEVEYTATEIGAGGIYDGPYSYSGAP